MKAQRFKDASLSSGFRLGFGGTGLQGTGLEDSCSRQVFRGKASRSSGLGFRH